MANADGVRIRVDEQRQAGRRDDLQDSGAGVAEYHRPEFPPGPNRLRAWRGVPAYLKPSICRVAYGVPGGMGSRTERLRALGNAVVPRCGEIVGRRLLEIIAALDAAGDSSAPGLLEDTARIG